MFRINNLIKAMAVAVLIVPLSGCWELLSWSPDGKTLAFVGGPDQSLWVWDRDTRRVEKVHGDDVYSCRFTPSGYLLYTAKPVSHGLFSGGIPEHEGDTLELHVKNFKNDVYFYEYHVCLESWADSREGSYIMYVTKKVDGPYELWKHNLDATHERTKVMDLPEAILLPALDDAGTRLAYVTKDSGSSLKTTDLETGTTTVLAQSDKEYAYPMWIDDRHIVYLEADGDDDDETGSLKVIDIDNKETRTVSELNVIGPRMHLDPARENIIVTARHPDRPKQWDSSLQVAKVNIESGAVTWLTEETFGAMWADYNATTDSLAYISAHNGDDIENATVRVIAVDSGHAITIWRDEEERLFATAEALRESGRPHEAVATYEDLISRFPEGRLRYRAHYRLMELYLSSEFDDLDKAYRAYTLAGSPEQAHRLLWARPAAAADDPPNDWIRKYGSEESKAEFQFDTDGPRDLIGFAAKWSPTRLYLRIEYGSARDLSGLVFTDSFFLFDADSPEAGLKQITPATGWDRGAERTLVFRHWFRSENGGQYDVTILNEKGEPRAWLSGSRFGTVSDAPVDLVETSGEYDGQQGALVLSIDPDLLGWKIGETVQIQVVTVKGGIEEHRGLERPRETVSDQTPGPLCDIADAFGAENTREVIDRQISEGQPSNATTIHGYALELVVPELKKPRN